jgi:hypothetical protein
LDFFWVYGRYCLEAGDLPEMVTLAFGERAHQQEATGLYFFHTARNESLPCGDEAAQVFTNGEVVCGDVHLGSVSGFGMLSQPRAEPGRYQVL